MSAKPFDWNVVIVGAWNRAILTPRGIATRLLELEPGTPVEVLVALDGMEPMRVKHESIVVIPSSARLVVAPVMMTDAGLKQAGAVAARAVESLPETPLSAAGVNIRYQCDTSPDEVIDALSSPLDEILGDADLQVVASTLKRSVAWKAGKLNLELQQTEDGTSVILCNFELRSQEPPALAEWVRAVDEMLKMARNLLQDRMSLTLEEVVDE